jgi:hypothetical protein
MRIFVIKIIILLKSKYKIFDLLMFIYNIKIIKFIICIFSYIRIVIKGDILSIDLIIIFFKKLDKMQISL